MKKLTVDFDGKQTEVSVLKFKGALWYHLNGETKKYEPDLNYGSSSGSKVSTEPGVVKAPMPGKIIKVAVSQGDRVSEGDTLIIMEAMKMEYTLKADVSGVISELTVTIDALVTAGQVLVRVPITEGEEGS